MSVTGSIASIAFLVVLAAVADRALLVDDDLLRLGKPAHLANRRVNLLAYREPRKPQRRQGVLREMTDGRSRPPLSWPQPPQQEQQLPIVSCRQPFKMR